jgi:hypothetical protein
VFVSAWDSKERARRRIVLVTAEAGAVDPALDRALNDVDLLRKVERHYVFVKMSPEEVPAPMKDAVARAGAGGLVLLEAARSVDGFGQKQSELTRVYPAVLDVKPGPHTKASALAALERFTR